MGAKVVENWARRNGNRTYLMINFYGENLILFLKMMVFGNENEKEGAKARLRLALHEHFCLLVLSCGDIIC